MNLNLFKKTPVIVRWEYMVMPITSHEDDNYINDSSMILNSMGAIGWELVTLQGYYAIFKRHAQTE